VSGEAQWHCDRCVRTLLRPDLLAVAPPSSCSCCPLGMRNSAAANPGQSLPDAS